MAAQFADYSPAGAGYPPSVLAVAESAPAASDMEVDCAAPPKAAADKPKEGAAAAQADSGGAAAGAAAEPYVRMKRKMAILMMSYSGTGYGGMQIQPEGGTIENALIDALFAAKLITKENHERIQTMNFQRCARTDKGVHAARQIVSLKMACNEPDVVSKINAHLPEQIRIMAYMRAPRSFNAKNQCTGRRYQYLAPSYAFCPKGKMTEADLAYKIDPERLTLINSVLAQYHGTKNYHNFTSRKAADDASAMRYIVSFTCEGPVVIDGVEFVKMTVCGQSFLLHMIRKMVGLTMAIVRGYTDLSILDVAFGPAKLDIPKAPGLGLLLDACFFDVYNKKYKGDKDHPPIGWPELDPAIDAFKLKNIFSKMVETEVSEKVIYTWLDTIAAHTFAPSVGEGGEAAAAAAVEGGPAAAAAMAREARWRRRWCFAPACAFDGGCYSTVCRDIVEQKNRKRKKQHNPRGYGTQKWRKRPKR